MTAMSFEDSLDFDIVSYNERNVYPSHHSLPRAISDKPPPRKRRRTIISCTECHRRKQKCDRKLPCTNCISRHKEDDCQYDSGAPTAKEQQQQQPKRPRRISSKGESLTPPGFESDERVSSITDAKWHQEPSPKDANHQNLPSTVSNITNLGYSTATTSTSTLSFLQKIENHHQSPSPPSPSTTTTTTNHDHNTHPTSATHLATREKYKSLIRQLPARLYLEKLVDVYFRDFNWQYYMLDRDIFDTQLEEWYKVPFEVFNNEGPGGIQADLRVFPALLFQIVAVAVLVLPEKTDNTGKEEGERHSEEGRRGVVEEQRSEEERVGSMRTRGHGNKAGVDFEALKYAGNMTFENLAKEYSEAGMAILSLLGKRQMTLTTVLAGFVRASFLKFVGSVPEAWHAIGSSIRDAQELGLHRSSLDPRPPPSTTAEAILQTQWEIQRRRKVWLNLVSWDIHCGATLGRPSTVDITTDPPVLPIDVVLPTTTSRCLTPIIPRTENDPPTPLTRILFTYRITCHLVSILTLERSASSSSLSPCPSSPSLFSRVDTLHNQLLSLEQSIPPYFLPSQPDTRFDHLPSCAWLPYARCILPQLIAFNFMALHRAYIFTRPLSRQLAVEKGCLAMLRAQRRHWGLLTKEMRRRAFTLFFGTFDAVVLMGAVYVLFPPSWVRGVNGGAHPGERKLVGDRGTRGREREGGKEKEMEKEMEMEKDIEKEMETVKEVVRQFKWAEERFEEMKERNPLARQARGVVRGIGERLGRALGEMGLELRDTALSKEGAAVGKPSGAAVGGGRRLARQRVIKPVTETHNGPSLALPTAFVSGTCIASRDSSTTTPAGASSTTPGFPTPMSTTPSSVVQTQFATTESNSSGNNDCFSDTFTFGTSAESIPIDPSLNCNPAPITSAVPDADWAATSTISSSMALPSLAEDFNWTDISPLYATGDLVYNDLTGFMYGLGDSVIDNSDYDLLQGGVNGDEVGGVRGGASNGVIATETRAHTGTSTEGAESDGMVELTRLEYDGDQGQSEPLWMFDGRIDEGSVWGLLNRY